MKNQRVVSVAIDLCFIKPVCPPGSGHRLPITVVILCLGLTLAGCQKSKNTRSSETGLSEHSEAVKPRGLSPGSSSGQLMRERLRKIGAALHEYLNQHRHYPMVAILSDVGKPLLSCRVELLKILDAQLYKQFKLDEPWDSEHNMKLVASMPDYYRTPTDDETFDFKTRILVVGDSHVFEPISKNRHVRIVEIKDGTLNTYVAAEADDEHAVTWTQPRKPGLQAGTMTAWRANLISRTASG